MSTDKLRRLALAATGTWEKEPSESDWSEYIKEHLHAKIVERLDLEEKAYIAAANPAAILELLDALKEADALVDEWTEIEAKNIRIPDLDAETHDEALAAFGYCAVKLQAILDKLCAS